MINRFKNIVSWWQPNCKWEKRWNSSSYSLQIICSDFIIAVVLKYAMCIARKNVVGILKKNEGTNLECNLVKLKGWTTPVLLCLKVCGKRDLKVIGGRNVWYFPCCNKPLGVLGWITCWIGPKPASRLWAPVQESQSEPKAPEHEAYPSKGDLSSLCLFCLSLAFPSTIVPYDISPFFWHRSLWLLVK